MVDVEKQGSQTPRSELEDSSVLSDHTSTREKVVWPCGWRPYACLVGCFFLMFDSWGLINAYGTYLAFYNETLLERQGLIELNLIGATQCFMILALSFIVGRLLDAGHSRLVIFVGFVLVTVGMYLLSVVNGNGDAGDGNYALTWLCQGFLAGSGMACFFVTSSQVVATWFHGPAKSFAVAFVASGAAISGLVFPFMLRFLITSHGFNFADQMVSTVAAVTIVAAWFLVRPNPDHEPRKPDKWWSVSTWIDKRAFRHTMWCWLTAGNCFMFLGFYPVFFNLEEWAVKKGVGTKSTPLPGENVLRTYFLLAIMNAASTIGRVASAFLSTRFAAVEVHCVVTTVTSLLCFLLWTFANTLDATLVFVVIFGAFSGSVIGLPPASMANILMGQTEKLGQWVGMMYTVSAPFALAGPLIAGLLVSEHGYRYITIQCWSGACLLCSAVCQSIAAYYLRKAKARANMAPKQVDSSGSSTLLT